MLGDVVARSQEFSLAGIVRAYSSRLLLLACRVLACFFLFRFFLWRLSWFRCPGLVLFVLLAEIVFSVVRFSVARKGGYKMFSDVCAVVGGFIMIVVLPALLAFSDVFFMMK